MRGAGGGRDDDLLPADAAGVRLVVAGRATQLAGGAARRARARAASSAGRPRPVGKLRALAYGRSDAAAVDAQPSAANDLSAASPRSIRPAWRPEAWDLGHVEDVVDVRRGRPTATTELEWLIVKFPSGCAAAIAGRASAANAASRSERPLHRASLRATGDHSSEKPGTQVERASAARRRFDVVAEAALDHPSMEELQRVLRARAGGRAASSAWPPRTDRCA